MPHRSFVITTLVIAFVTSCGVPKNIYVQNGKLAPCPKSPNCVSSQSDSLDEKHYMNAWSFSDINEAKSKVKNAIVAFGNAKILKEEDDYIHAVFITGFWRYKDDVEFYFDSSNGLIHFRSASRLGYGDMGVNRKRMQKLEMLYLQ